MLNAKLNHSAYPLAAPVVHSANRKQKPEDLRLRTRQFAVRIIHLYSALPKTTVGQVIGKQLLRAGTSVGAQYHEGCRSRSPAEFISKLESALQELEEVRYWLILLIEAEVMPSKRLNLLIQEAAELVAILTASAKKAKSKSKLKSAK